MKYLLKFESYNQETPTTEISTTEISNIENKTSEYINVLDNTEKIKIRQDLEKFAKDHGVSFDDLQDPELVKSLLLGVDEGFGDWISKNWYAVVDKVSKYLRIGSIVTFIGGLVGYFGFGVDTMTVLKVAAMSYIIANVVACLKGLK
jgi:hypothetical protein